MAVAAIFVSTGAFAGGPLVEFGVKAGINTGNFDLNKINFNNAYYLVNEARTGYHAGVFMRLDFVALHLQPEFNYNFNRYDMKVLGHGDSATQSTNKVRVQTFEVPVLVGFDLLFLRFNAGPVFNVWNDTSMKSGATTVADVDITKPSVSWAAGLGVDLMKVSLDIRYNGQFKRADQNISISESDAFNFKNNFRGWTFSVGYTF